MTAYQAFEGREIEGVWWNPARPNARVPGVISVTGGVMFVTFRFAGLSESAVRRQVFSSADVLNGIADNRQITLLNCSYAGSKGRGSPHAGFHASARYAVEAALIGIHTSLADPPFKRISVSFAHLEEWLGYYPFDLKVQKKRTDRFVIRYKSPQQHMYVVPALNARIGIQYSWHFDDTDENQDRRLGSSAWVTLESSEPQSGRWFNANLWRFRLLLTSLLGVQTWIRGITGEMANGETPETGTQIEILYSDPRPEAPSLVHASRLFVTHQDIRKQWPGILRKWFKSSEDMQTATELYVSALSDMRMYLHHRFSLMAQSLETFHRKTQPGYYVPAARYSRVKAAIIEAIPPFTKSELREAIVGKLNYGNELSLKKRLDALMKSLPDEAQGLIAKNPKEFMKRVADTRNYFAHWDESTTKKRLTDAEIPAATVALQVMFTAVLLARLGMSRELILNGIASPPRQYPLFP